MTHYVVAIASIYNGNDFRYLHVEARGRSNAVMGVLCDPTYANYQILGIEEESSLDWGGFPFGCSWPDATSRISYLANVYKF